MLFLKHAGWYPILMQALKRVVRLGRSVSFHLRRIWFGMPSGPGALFGEALSMAWRISWGVMSGRSSGSGYSAFLMSSRSAGGVLERRTPRAA